MNNETSPVSESPQSPSLPVSKGLWAVRVPDNLAAIFCEDKQITDWVYAERPMLTMLQAIADAHNATLPVSSDTERLEWLDDCNRRLNDKCGSRYGWELILSHNVTRLMLESPYVAEFAGVDLNDSAFPGKRTCREAIDAAMALVKKEANVSAVNPSNAATT